MSFLENIKEWPGRFRNFLADVRTELKKTSWPSKKEVYGTTLVVILTVFFFGIYLFLVDLALQHAVQKILSLF
jgi:preprotein translocase subunit SecE